MQGTTSTFRNPKCNNCAWLNGLTANHGKSFGNSPSYSSPGTARTATRGFQRQRYFHGVMLW